MGDLTCTFRGFLFLFKTGNLPDVLFCYQMILKESETAAAGKIGSQYAY